MSESPSLTPPEEDGFPSTRNILSALVAEEAHTPEGQLRRAQELVAFAERHKLGDAIRLVPFPEGAPFAEQKPHPANVVIDVKGSGGGQRLLVHAHYDTIDPRPHYKKGFERDPHLLTPSMEDPDVCFGVGAYDVLQGVAASLVAAKRLRELQRDGNMHHDVRFLLSPGEENQSEGTYAAFHPADNLVAGSHCLLELEIPVKANLADPPAVCIGRQGRVGIRLVFEGLDAHSGTVREEDAPLLLAVRQAIAQLRIPHIKFPERPEEHFRVMPPSRCLSADWGCENPAALSVPHVGTIDLSILYSNTSLSVVQIIDTVRHQIASALSAYGIDPSKAFTIHREPGRRTPFIEPYLETLGRSYVELVRRSLGSHTGRTPDLIVGNGTADDAMIVRMGNIPGVSISAQGDSEHTSFERVRVSSIEKHVIPTIIDLACHNGPLYVPPPPTGQ